MTELLEGSAMTESGVARTFPACPQMIDLPRVLDARGNLTFLESGRHVPFTFNRVYYTYDVPGGESRGGHAHKRCHSFVIAASGSFDVVVDDGATRNRFFLNRSYRGLWIPPMTWREIMNFSSGSVCLVLASDFYEEEDYHRDYDQFRRSVGRGEE